mmetsp:Transcript_17818/g.44924  ORF Transcript_17818/g.44924 Transcript_17818/m.44924 type:complete len:198 (-) Transcript_17818:41-634(-)
MLTVEQPPFLIGGGSMHCFRGGAPQAAVRKEGSLDFESAAFCDTTGHQNDREEEDGEGAVRRDEDFDDDFDDEDPVSPNWREEFESLMEEDKTRAAEKAAKKRLSEQEPTSTGPLKCLSVLNRLHCPFGSQEDEPPPKTPDPDRPASPVDSNLGTITFFYEGINHTALQTPGGCVVFEGQRYDSIRAWFRDCFKKRL